MIGIHGLIWIVLFILYLISESLFEFYKKDPSKAPSALKRRLEENDSSILAQQRFIYDQDLLKSRVNLRFDEELVKLKTLWAIANAPVGNLPKP